MGQALTEPQSRPGPRPLGLHLLTATNALMSSQGAFRSWRSGSSLWSQASAAQALRQDLARLDDPGQKKVQEQIDREIRRRLDAFHCGVAAYRRHPYLRRTVEATVAWQQGTTRLLDYGGPGRPLLVVPSLVNRGYVLDLTPETSLLGWLLEAGFRPLLVDWGAPGSVETGFDLTDYVGGRLISVLDLVSHQAGGAVPVVGYCMGGLLALALARASPAKVAGLVLMATPWDFQAANQDQAVILAGAAQVWEPVLSTLGVLPVEAIQSLFWCLDPFAVIQKFIKFADIDQRSSRATLFVALEDWLNDGVPLAARVARECLREWYGANTPTRGEWRVGGAAVDPAEITCRTLVVVSDHDRIVPAVSAEGLVRELSDPAVIRSSLGHVGMVVGNRARTRVWQPVADWLGAA